jgi:HNH endonuclease
MSRTKITTVGQLSRMEDGALLYSLFASETGWTVWLEALSNTEDWPSLGPVPLKPKYDPPHYSKRLEHAEWKTRYDKAKEEWERAAAAYRQAMHSDSSYADAASNFMMEQQSEPQLLRTALDFFHKDVWSRVGRNPPKGCTSFFAYRGKVLRVESTDPEVFMVVGNRYWMTETGIALVKQYVLRREKQYEKVQREIDAFENMEKLEGVSREPVPESVRLFVWQRDKGQCVKCGSRERLEFDHIIPITAGGSSTERNVQLLCESCNRSKGATI